MPVIDILKSLFETKLIPVHNEPLHNAKFILITPIIPILTFYLPPCPSRLPSTIWLPPEQRSMGLPWKKAKVPSHPVAFLGVFGIILSPFGKRGADDDEITLNGPERKKQTMSQVPPPWLLLHPYARPQ